jgi:hypothetical protein
MALTKVSYSMITGALVNALDHGAVGDGATDNYSAIVSALAKAATLQTTVYFPPGTYNISSASLGANGLTIASNVAVMGQPNESRIVVTGTTPCNLFRSSNASNIGLFGLVLRGNSQSDSNGNGLCFYAQQTVGATQNCENIVVDRCRVENFKGDYWLRFESLNTTYPMQNVWVQNCTFNSESGNARNPSNIGVPSYCVQFYGPESGSVCLQNIVVSNNIANCKYIKGFVVIWQSVKLAQISGNIVNDSGVDAVFPDDVGTYAFLIYKLIGAGVDPNNIDVSNNIVNNVRSAGLYMAEGLDIRITNFSCNNQTDTVDVTLPKGAIAINGSNRIYVDTLVAVGCARGLQLVGKASGEYFFNNINIKATAASAEGVNISCNGQAELADFANVTINLYGASSTAFKLRQGSTFAFNNFNLQNFQIYGRFLGLQFNRFDGTTPACKNIHVGNGVISGATSYGIEFASMTNGFQKAVFENIVFGGDWGAAAYQAGFAGSTNFVCRNFTFCDEPNSFTGVAFDGSGAQGSIQGFQYINCPTAAYRVISTGGEDLGRDTPTWTAVQGVFVQNLLPTSGVPIGWVRDGSSAWIAT